MGFSLSFCAQDFQRKRCQLFDRSVFPLVPCSTRPSSTGWASSVVRGLVAAAGGVGFISGLFVAGGLWGAVQCFWQVLLGSWPRCNSGTP